MMFNWYFYNGLAASSNSSPIYQMDLKYDPVLAGSLGIWVPRLDKYLFEVLIEV